MKTLIGRNLFILNLKRIRFISQSQRLTFTMDSSVIVLDSDDEDITVQVSFHCHFCVSRHFALFAFVIKLFLEV